jgi:hypothetical protein
MIWTVTAVQAVVMEILSRIIQDLQSAVSGNP